MGQFKYIDVADALEKMLDAGTFSAGKLPSEQEMMAKFNVGKITVYKALDRLVKHKRIVRIKGRGTFVAEKSDGGNPNYILSRAVGVIMPCNGHYYGDFYECIKKALLVRGYFPVAFDVPQKSFDDFFYHNNIDAILKSDFKGIIIHGNAYWQCPFLENHKKVKTVFIDQYDYSGVPFSGMAVLVDYNAAAYMATRHLLEQGKKNIVYLKHPWDIAIKVTDSHMMNNPRGQLENGYKRALKEFGCEGKEKIYTIAKDYADFQLQVKGLLARDNDCIDGVVCASDCAAIRIMNAAIAAKINIPDDIMITGMFNTPWCWHSPIPLTSVDMNSRQITENAVEMLLGDIPPNMIKVTPSLMKRESTGCDSGQKTDIYKGEYLEYGEA